MGLPHGAPWAPSKKQLRNIMKIRDEIKQHKRKNNALKQGPQRYPEHVIDGAFSQGYLVLGLSKNSLHTRAVRV